jgi:hypothetical protein
VCTALLDKNRHKRPSLEVTLGMSWFESLKGSQDAAGGKFSQFAMTKSGAEAVKAEGDKVVTSMKENEEK